MNAVTLAAEWDADPPPELPTWTRLEEIQVPAIVACGELDLPFFVAQCRVLAERLPGAGPAVVLPGVAHLPGLEAPGMVAALIAAAVGG
jgi:pimeloyl-ACP methyl ester carboxylesterase